LEDKATEHQCENFISLAVIDYFYESLWLWMTYLLYRASHFDLIYFQGSWSIIFCGPPLTS
jgi:hypothetical protein